MLVDTHCHIHDPEFYTDDREVVYQRAVDSNVAMVVVGTDIESSRAAIEFASEHKNVWAVIGVHPHDTKNGWQDIASMLGKAHTNEKIVGVGEIGLDYYYNNSPKDVQIHALEQQLQYARDAKLPVSFHVREAYDDFWAILANFSGTKGVLHSFTDSIKNLNRAIDHDLYIGVNGISTFAHDKQTMFAAIPIERMVLETDAPFLTPIPFRGKINEPAFVRNVAEYHATMRQVTLEYLARVTTANARELFSI